jgi:ketosteroid isomerase-like protein
MTQDAELLETTTGSSLELVQNLFAAFGKGDVQFILDHVADDCRWVAPGEGIPASGVHIGPAGVGHFFQTLVATEQITLFEPRNYFQKGDEVVVLGAEEMQVIKTGKRAATNWVMVFGVSDAKVTRFEMFFDTAAYARAHQETA